ncbi:MAG: phospholipase D family protein [Gammaproteobacteria bacterium]|nr:phospholipase D family protein [Gammaproteobacteria bacterium]
MKEYAWKFTTWMAAAVLAIGLASCADLPPNTDRTASHVLEDTQDTFLGRNLARESQGHPGESGFHVLNNGLDAFVARVALANAAERSIDTQYYMIHNDVVGSLFIDSLLKAADRGVRVRLLVDDIDQGGRDEGAAILDFHPNIDVRIFNPFGRNVGRTVQFATGFGKQTRRAHNKSFTVDNLATILGGRNIGDEYFNADPTLAFADMDVLSIGPVAREVSSSFDLYWNSDLAYPIASLVKDLPTREEAVQRKKRFDELVEQQRDSRYLQHLLNSDLARQLMEKGAEGGVVYSWGVGKVVADEPEKLKNDTGDSEFRLMEQLRPYLEGVTSELIIFSPYFIPGKAGSAFLGALRKKGVRVRILTNSLSSTDVAAVHSGYSKYREQLLRLGIELYEVNERLSKEQREVMKEGGIGDSKASLHAKSFVLDREQVFIGSLNLDPRSIIQNTEIGVVFESQEIAEPMGEWFDKKIDQVAFRLELEDDGLGGERIAWHGLVDGKQQTLYVDPYTSVWQRFVVGFLRIFPVESQM